MPASKRWVAKLCRSVCMLTRLRDAGPAARLFEQMSRCGQVVALVERGAGEQPALGAILAPVLPQQLEQSGRQPRVAVLLAFPLPDANHHSLAVDVFDAEME